MARKPRYEWYEEAVAKDILMEVRRVREVIDSFFYHIEKAVIGTDREHWWGGQYLGHSYGVHIRNYGEFYAVRYIVRKKGHVTMRFRANKRVRKNMAGRSVEKADLRPVRLSVEED